MDIENNDVFFREYTSQDAIAKYTRATAGFGISYLLDHYYKAEHRRDSSRLMPRSERAPCGICQPSEHAQLSPVLAQSGRGC